MIGFLLVVVVDLYVFVVGFFFHLFNFVLPHVVTYACNPRTCGCGTWEVKTGASGVQGQPEIHNEVKNSLGNMRPFLKKTKQTNQEII